MAKIFEPAPPPENTFVLEIKLANQIRFCCFLKICNKYKHQIILNGHFSKTESLGISVF
jgi:hypothetical protein